TISDYTPDEQKRQCSIQTSIIPLEYNGYKINLLDVPGSDDFIGETIGITGTVKGAILVIDASVGVQVGTVKHYNMLRKRGIPTFIFVNKMDKEDVEFDLVLEDIREQLGKEVISFCYPLGHEHKFDGFANAVDLKAHIYNGKECVEAEIYPDKRAKILELNNTIVEEVAKTNDELMEKFFNGETFTQEEIRSALRQGVLSGELTPLIVGSATKNIGCQTLLNMFISYLPSPADLKPLAATDENGNEKIVPTDNNEPVSAYVFKTVVDPYVGIINYIKVCSGVLRVGEDVYVNGGNQRVSSLFSVSGKNMKAVDEITAGDIGGITKLDKVSTGDTLSSPKSITIYKRVKYPTAVIFKSIVLNNKNDESKLGPALAKIQLENPDFEVKRNNETKQLLIGGVSDSYLAYVVEKLKNTYKVDLTVEQPKVVYRESIKGTAEGDGRYVKQSGGSGFYGVVKMRFEPSEENVFAEEIFGGAVPKNYFPAVEKGFFEALNSGLLAGFPVIGVKGVLVDGKYHPVDSNEQAFKMAGVLAFKDAYMKCRPIILEPIIKIFVNVDSKYTGNVLSDLSSRRARIQNIEEKEHGSQEIEALIPEAEIIDYATQLKSLTQASGFFNREFYGYEELPDYLKDKVIQENKLI
ncbi:MAG: elongation factor G, partial [Bacilli bacterium]|nr:elongation factor G [Bacilli bacterium]